MNPLLGNQQNYSGYMLLCLGILSILTDFKLESNKANLNHLIKNEKGTTRVMQTTTTEYVENDRVNMHTTTANSGNFTQEVKIQSSDYNDNKQPQIENNPYDIPEDF